LKNQKSRNKTHSGGIMGTTLETVLENINDLQEHIKYYANCCQVNIDEQNLSKAILELEKIAKFISNNK